MRTGPKTRTGQPWRAVIWPGLPLVAGVLALAYLMAQLVPVGVDYAHYFEPIGLRWLRGDTALYDASSAGYYNPPWALLITLPFSLLPQKLGFALFTLSSLGLLAAAMKLLYPGPRLPLLALLLALGSLPTLDLVQRGQLDAWPIFGVALAFWSVKRGSAGGCSLGLLLLSVKPVSVWLATIFLIRHLGRWPWSWRRRALILPISVLVGSLVLVGPDWPLRLAASLLNYPPQRAYRIDLATRLGLPTLLSLGLPLVALVVAYLWTRRLNDLATLNRAILLGALTVPYLLSYNLAVVLVGPFGELWHRDRRLAAILYVLSLTPLTRFVFGLQYIWLDLAFPIALTIALAWQDRPDRGGTKGTA